MKKWYCILFIVALLALVVAPVWALAQEATPDVTPPPVDVPPEPPVEPGGTPVPPETALEEIINLILRLTPVGAGVSALIATLTGAIRKLAPKVNAAWVNVGLSVLLWALYWIAADAGLTALYEGLVQGVDAILVGVLGVVLSSLGASRIHEEGHKAKLPFVGYKPPKPERRAA